jgi:transketolase
VLAIGLERFGSSAPAETLASEFGFTPESVAARVLLWLRGT